MEKTNTSYLKSFQHFKSQNPDAIHLFRTGDVYETYEQDAIDTSKVLGLSHTYSKGKSGFGVNNPDGAIFNFPFYALDTYLPKLVRAGKRVAILDQLELLKKDEIKHGYDLKELVTPGLTMHVVNDMKDVSDILSEEAMLRDTLIEKMRSAGISVSTDVVAAERVLEQANGNVRLMGSRVNKKQIAISSFFEGKELTEKQRAFVDVYSGKKKETSVEIVRPDRHFNLSVIAGKEEGLGVKHSLLKHFDTTIGVFNELDILKISDIIEKGDCKTVSSGYRKRNIYQLAINDTRHTVVTEVRKNKEIFGDYYTNQKARPLDNEMANADTLEGAGINSGNALSFAKVQKISDTSKKKEDNFLKKYDVPSVSLHRYVEAMQNEDLGEAQQAYYAIRRAYKESLTGEDRKLSVFSKRFAELKAELYSSFGNVDDLRQQYIEESQKERDLMEAARQKELAVIQAEQDRLQPLHDMTDAELDADYMLALERNDESRMRDIIDVMAERRGYDSSTDYQGMGAFAAPSNPGFETDEERRNSLEEYSPDVNIEDIALGYSPQPDDYFNNPRGYMYDTPHGLESSRTLLSAMNAVRRGETPMVKVYRAVPNDIKEGMFRNGDWVTPSLIYANNHGAARFGVGEYHIIEKEVPANQLWWDGNDINEWGYDDGKGYRYKNTKNNIKFADLITYDDNGYVILPSQRFNENKADMRYHLAYHGSGNDFDEFNHSHMGEGEGAQAYGWGTYVTEVESIGRMYAEQGRGKYLYKDQNWEKLWHSEHTPEVLAALDVIERREKFGHYETFNESKGKVIQDAEAAIANFGDDASYTDSVEHYREKINVLEKMCESDFFRKEKILYIVEIPDDNGRNYFDYASEIDIKEKEKIRKFFTTAVINNMKNSLPSERMDVRKSISAEFRLDVSNGNGVYKTMSKYLPDKEVSLLLYSLGYKGIKYPAEYQRGGREDKANNYVIFSEDDIKIKDKVNFFKTQQGQAYGFVHNGTIYIDPRISTAETPLHEYTHLWAEVLRQRNPEEWKNIVKMMKETPEVWNYVRRVYPSLTTDNEIADEALAHFSGKRGYERLKAMSAELSEPSSVLDRISSVLEKFWSSVASFFGVHYTSKEEVADRILFDLLKEVNPLDYKTADLVGIRESKESNDINEHRVDLSLSDSSVPQRLSPADIEAGGALVDRLNAMGIDVHTDIQENRKVLKAAEHDNSEAGKLRYFKTENGTSYGFAYHGSIYLDPRKIDAELPLHEFAHLWCQALRRINPKNWENVVSTIKEDAASWNFVKDRYPDLTDENDLVEEVIAQYSGKRGAVKLQAELQRMTRKEENYRSRWNAVFANVSKAIQDFWKHIGDSFNIKYKSSEDVYDQILKDFATKVSPIKKLDTYLKNQDIEYLRAVTSGDTEKAKSMFLAALQENIGNGVTPFVAVDGYRGKLQALSHKVKETTSPDFEESIETAAKLMSPLIPENAVLIPAPSHKGYATDMLTLCNKISEIRTDLPVANILVSAPRASQYDIKKETGKPLPADKMGIFTLGEVPDGKIPVVIDNVVHSGNTAEACIKALGKGIVVALSSAASQDRHVSTLKSAAPIVYDRDGLLVPLSARFELKDKYLGKIMNYKPLGTMEENKEKQSNLQQELKDAIKQNLAEVHKLLSEANLENKPLVPRLPVVVNLSKDWRDDIRVFTSAIVKVDDIILYENNSDVYDNQDGVSLKDLPEESQLEVLDVIKEHYGDEERYITLHVTSASMPLPLMLAFDGDPLNLSKQKLSIVDKFKQHYPGCIFIPRDDEPQYESKTLLDKPAYCVKVDVFRNVTMAQLREEKKQDDLGIYFETFAGKEYPLRDVELPTGETVSVATEELQQLLNQYRDKEGNFTEPSAAILDSKIEHYISSDKLMFSSGDELSSYIQREGKKMVTDPELLNRLDWMNDVFNDARATIGDSFAIEPVKMPISDPHAVISEIRYIEDKEGLVSEGGYYAGIDEQGEEIPLLLAIDSLASADDLIAAAYKAQIAHLVGTGDAIDYVDGYEVAGDRKVTSVGFTDGKLNIQGYSRDNTRFEFGDGMSLEAYGELTEHIRELRETELLENWQDKAHDFLIENNSDNVSSDIIEDFLTFHWQNKASNEENLKEFTEYVKEVQNSNNQKLKLPMKKEEEKEVSKEKELSPILRHFEELKKKYPDTLLLFRVGDFYEGYREDAKTLADKLGITLTYRVNEEKVYTIKDAMAGFPQTALDTYLPKLVQAGCRVALLDSPLQQSMEQQSNIEETSRKNNAIEVCFSHGKTYMLQPSLNPVKNAIIDSLKNKLVFMSNSGHTVDEFIIEKKDGSYEMKIWNRLKNSWEIPNLRNNTDKTLLIKVSGNQIAVSEFTRRYYGVPDSTEFIGNYHININQNLEEQIMNPEEKKQEESVEQVTAQQSAEQSAEVKAEVATGEKKKHPFANIDYTKYQVPEGMTIEKASVYPKKDAHDVWFISATVNGERQTRQLYANDRFAYFAKHEDGSHRATLAQLAAKYFANQMPKVEKDKGAKQSEAQQSLAKPEEKPKAEVQKQKEHVEQVQAQQSEERKPEPVSVATVQATLLAAAITSSIDKGGIWMNEDCKRAPRFTSERQVVSPYNAMMMNLHSDAQGYKSNVYTTFSEAKSAGNSIKSGQKAISFNWYGWDKYVNKYDATNVITKEEYEKLPADEKEMYKARRTKEERPIFNIDQTIMSSTAKDKYAEFTNPAEVTPEAIRESNEQLTAALVALSGDEKKVEVSSSKEATYDAATDTLILNDLYGEDMDSVYKVAIDNYRAAVEYLNAPARLNLSGRMNLLPADHAKYDKLVQEVASGVILARQGVPAQLSKENYPLIPFWNRELTENPKIVERLESDVNNVLSVVGKLRKGEEINFSAMRGEKSVESLCPKQYTIASHIAEITNMEQKQVVIIKDEKAKTAAVVLPVGASIEVNNESPGMSKVRFASALKKEGFEDIQFYNAGGFLGLNQSNEYFAGKDITLATLKQYNIVPLEKIDVSQELAQGNKADIDKVLIIKDDDNRNVLYVKPACQEPFTIYPEPSDVRLFFANLNNPARLAEIREDLGQKYYDIVQKHPDLKASVLVPKHEDVDVSRITEVSIFKSKYKQNTFMLSATIDGEKQKAIELSGTQAQRMFLVVNRELYKTHLAAEVFGEKLKVTETTEVTQFRGNNEAGSEGMADKETTEKTSKENNNREQSEEQQSRSRGRR